jgi:protein-L-isoaspartate(D-aspartate) O-methyltransferase
MTASPDFPSQRALMIEAQVRTNDVPNRRVQQALGAVPRELFMPKPMRSFAYAELEIEAGHGRWVWRPRDVAKLLNALDPQANEVALVIAGGAGYSAAALAQLCETVIVLDAGAERITLATRTLSEAGADNAVAVAGDLMAGRPADGPYGVIWVDGAVAEVAPAWLDQLAEGGRLGVIVREGSVARARVYTKARGAASARNVFEATVPQLTEFAAVPAFRF